MYSLYRVKKKQDVKNELELTHFIGSEFDIYTGGRGSDMEAVQACNTETRSLEGSRRYSIYNNVEQGFLSFSVSKVEFVNTPELELSLKSSGLPEIEVSKIKSNYGLQPKRRYLKF
jgi:hypothetical protein